jgi:ATP-dependent Lon protease
LNELYAKLTETKKDCTTEQKITELQTIIDKLSTLLATFGTKSIDDLLSITFGADVNEPISDELADKFRLLRKFVHPVGFKIIAAGSLLGDPATLCTNKITDDILKYETTNHLECFNCDPTTAVFYQKVYGIKVVIRCDKLKKTMVINGLVDDVGIEVLENRYIKSRKRTIGKLKCDSEVLTKQLDIMTLKEILVYSDTDIGKRNASIVALSQRTRTDKLEKTIQHFTTLDTYGQRNTLIDLLTRTDDGELKYTAYLLYDVISSDSNMDSNAQMMIYDSFPFQVKMYFKDAMKHTMNYTQQITQKYDVSKLSLEQQVYAMRVPESVKEKALVKLKEVKNKSDDSNGKAKQYLDGLLKIPFGEYREEPLLKMTKKINAMFQSISDGAKPNYTNMEIYKSIDKLSDELGITELPKLTKSQTDQVISILGVVRGKTAKQTVLNIHEQFMNASQEERLRIAAIVRPENTAKINSIVSINKQLTQFEKTMDSIDAAFDASVYGQNHAKKQLKKIIGQWITGEQKGHCFGFEGSPGIGKTSLAKYGLSQCLLDEDGKPRPFTFIALGGSCNGSSLEGHGYTYVNSMWGTIAQSVMDARCMNPILFFDEADKTNKEHGNEINGILTHLTDYTQNDTFNDRFFNGVPLNLSKALIIFSYNDPALIDPVLLDRIHRIKFENLTLDEKVVISKDYIIPLIVKDMGLGNIVSISDELIRWLIKTYTAEPGVRKLKELLFDLYGEINIELLKRPTTKENLELPVILTKERIAKYLIKYHKIQEQCIHPEPQVGVINGLYANSMGGGGIIQIEASLFPSNTFLDLKLTGMQGDVMKESMHVAKTLAWSLCSPEVRKRLQEDEKVGIHIHTPDGATKKDGPSAGTAETTVIYSVFNNLKIKNTVAITGEIDLRGNVTAIGGLSNKILGGLRAGVKTFIYPKENADDFLEYQRNNPDRSDGITFMEVSHIDEVFKYVFLSE